MEDGVSQVSDLCSDTFLVMSSSMECYGINLFAFCIETVGIIFVNNILICFCAILLYLISFVFIIGYCISIVYVEHLWMGVIGSQVSNLCSKTFLVVRFSLKFFASNFIHILSRDYSY